MPARRQLKGRGLAAIVSGTHGVEGYAGSAIQLLLRIVAAAGEPDAAEGTKVVAEAALAVVRSISAGSAGQDALRGAKGISILVRTLDAPVYLCKVMGNKLFCLDREANTLTLSVDKTEFLFKTALLDRSYDEVLRIIKRSKLCGQAIIGYLQKKGFPEVALQFEIGRASCRERV